MALLPIAKQIVSCKTDQGEKLVKVLPVLLKSCPVPFDS